MKLAFLFLFFFPNFAWSKLDLPKNMNGDHRERSLETLGFGSALKVLADPYPLGGYSGVEVGLSYEVITTTELAELGDKPASQGETGYFLLSLAKGLYYNVDMFLNLAPMNQAEEITTFGGGLRWGFFEAEYLPITLSTQIGANSTSFQNLINVSTQSMDLIASLNFEATTIYLGLGTVRVSGTFMGGTEGVTDSGNVESHTLSGTRFLGGLAVRFSRFFTAIEFDRTIHPTYGAKIGLRF